MASFGSSFVVILAIAFGLYYYLYKDNFDGKLLHGKRVLITGASSGIGEHTAYEFARFGARLILTARREELLAEVSSRCKELGAESVHIFPADMSKSIDRKKMTDFTKEKLSGLDYLILNHAILGSRWWKSTAKDMAQLTEYMDVNFLSYAEITSLLIDNLKESKGHIGVVSSVAGIAGNAGLTQYAAAKHALHGFFSSLRQELRFLQTGVSVTIGVFGPVCTESAFRAVKEAGSKLDYQSQCGSVAEAAESLVRAVSARLYKFHFTKFAIIFDFLNKLIPGHTEDFICWYMNKDKR